MPLDTNIALQVRPFQMESPINAMSQMYQLQGAQQANQLNSMKMAEYERARTEEEGLRNFLAGADIKAPQTRAELTTRIGKTGLGYAKALAEQESAAIEQKVKQLDYTTKMTEAAANIYGTVKDDASWQAARLKLAALGGDPSKLPETYDPNYVNQEKMAAVKVKDQLTLLAPKPMQVKRADGSIIFLDQNPNSPTFQKEVMPAQVTGMTPFQQAEVNARQGQLAVSQGQLKVSQGQLKVAQDRLAKDGAALDPAENAAISKAIIEGRLDPNRVNGRNAKILATTLLANPDANVLELGVSASGATAAERSLATQTAKMSTAANEANKMVDVVRTLSDKVDRTEFPTVNAITNAVSKGTGGKEIVQLNASINALVNSYARAISPTGQPTVSDKNHAREVINSAYSTGQISAILDVMQQEMSIAREAAGTASTELKASREKARGRGEEKPATGALSAAEQTELDQLRQRFKK
jgi:hypothetical protein